MPFTSTGARFVCGDNPGCLLHLDSNGATPDAPRPVHLAELLRDADPDAHVTSDRLQRQLEFIVEIDKAKSILRNSLVIEEGRRENDAEHAWHLAVMARSARRIRARGKLTSIA